MFKNDKESSIIKTFSINIFNNNYATKTMLLCWDSGKITARFSTCFEDDNDLEPDNPNYEEFDSFWFDVIKIEGNPPPEVYNN